MIIVLKQDAPDVQVREFCHELEDMGLQSSLRVQLKKLKRLAEKLR